MATQVSVSTDNSLSLSLDFEGLKVRVQRDGGSRRNKSDPSGLEPNLGKSDAFLSSMNEEMKLALVESVGFRLGALSFRYLGVPVILTKLNATDFQGLVERIIARVKVLTNKFLSFADSSNLSIQSSLAFNHTGHIIFFC